MYSNFSKWTHKSLDYFPAEFRRNGDPRGPRRPPQTWTRRRSGSSAGQRWPTPTGAGPLPICSFLPPSIFQRNHSHRKPPSKIAGPSILRPPVQSPRPCPINAMESKKVRQKDRRPGKRRTAKKEHHRAANQSPPLLCG